VAEIPEGSNNVFTTEDGTDLPFSVVAEVISVGDGGNEEGDLQEDYGEGPAEEEEEEEVAEEEVAEEEVAEEEAEEEPEPEPEPEPEEEE